MKKNEFIELNITDIGVRGEGIGKAEGFPFFVKDAVIGDTVRAVITRMKKGYGYAKMIEIIKPSSFRINAPCANARRCGGCQIMELCYPEQLKFKERKVRTNLERIGGLKEIPLLPIIGMEQSDKTDTVPTGYRNKMQFPFGRGRDGEIVAGFYAGRTHSIIDTEECLVAPDVCNRILKAVRDFVVKHKISVYNEMTGQGLVRHLVLRTGFRTGEVMVCLVLNGESLNEASYTQNVDNDTVFVEYLLNLPLTKNKICSICISENRENTNVIMGQKIRCLYGKDYIYDEICCGGNGKHLRFKISPLSFYQVNPVQMEKLYQTALEYADLTGKERVFDLYCGTGTISLFLAKQAKEVVGVEIVPEAIRDAEENAKSNQITNASFICGKSEEVFPEYVRAYRTIEEENGPDDLVVVLDPPRKGCEKVLLEAIRNVSPERIVYISCDSATLARDLKYLTGGEDTVPGEQNTYRIEKVQPVDMFPNSVHVECVTLLTRRER
ncbi:MAG: 23S rRNA (uracil(1939)-C(5))-methyltransferase RlmD [Parasporobacterium sp.]|nr:23S rRNA (uracil(1939)-C(5))-methyltransferase RlmD [Parasporobacterium sp.]